MIELVSSNVFYFFVGAIIGFLSAIRIFRYDVYQSENYFYITMRTEEIGNIHFKYFDYDSAKEDFDILKKKAKIKLSEIYLKDDLINERYIENYLDMNSIDFEGKEEMIYDSKHNPNSIIFNIKSIRWGDGSNVFQHYEML
jgi:hypothetical protein